MNDRRIFVGIHGRYGVGKSVLLHTLPGPRLILDTEGGSYDAAAMGYEVVPWDPSTEKVPDVSGDVSVIVDVPTPDLFTSALAFLRQGKHPFESAGMDSFTELQKQVKEKVSDYDHKTGQLGAYDPNAAFDMQAWGRLLAHGEIQIRRMRDLSRPKSADNPKPINTAIVIPSDVEAMPIRPLLQGAMRKALPGFLDLLGYLHIADVDGTPTRLLQVEPSPTVEAKCRLHMVRATLGAQIANPNLTEIISVANQTPKKGK